MAVVETMMEVVFMKTQYFLGMLLLCGIRDCLEVSELLSLMALHECSRLGLEQPAYGRGGRM